MAVPMDLLPDAVIAVDEALRITALNDAACRLTGYPAHELIGQPCAGCLRPRDEDGNALWAGGWHRSASLRSVKALTEQTVALRRRDGREVTVTATGAYWRDANGAVTGAVVCLRNAPRRAREAMSGIEVISTVSHELRSPLTSIAGYTGLLLNRWGRLLDDQKLMMLEQIHHDADRVTRLMAELLDVSRLEAGRLELHRQLIDLPRLAGEVIEKTRLQYPALDAEARFPDGFPKVYADPDKIEQVLTNLVENACKYGSPRGLCIEGWIGDDAVSVAVNDHGEGIPSSDLPKVFTKFFRRAVGRPSGSGLGLWICRQLVEWHGGQLVAESNSTAGTTFRFTLPLIDLDRLQKS
jgi:PAS domain S-box-containing protein